MAISGSNCLSLLGYVSQAVACDWLKDDRVTTLS